MIPPAVTAWQSLPGEPPQGHGTEASYVWERRHGVPTCPECRQAHVRYRQDRRAAKRPPDAERRDEHDAIVYLSWPHPTWKPSAGEGV